MKISLFLALKYMKPKRSVASAITVVSIVGVMLGVSAVIIVRGVMTGFGDIWERKILDFKPHISLVPTAGNVINDEDELVGQLRPIGDVISVTPEIDTRIMLSYKGRVLAPVLLGIGGDDFHRAYKVGAPLAGSFDLEPDTIIVGRHVARQLGAWVGDEVTVYSPKILAAKDEIHLPRKWKIGGIFSCGQYDYDSGYVICSLPDARDLMGMEEGVFAIHLKTREPADQKIFSATLAKVSEEIKSPPPRCPSLRLITWQEADKELFAALAVEKNMTAILLLLISVVALFCVMNTLLVLTVQKTPQIGLLKALGFSKRQIMGIFMTHGLIQCSIGIVLGLLASWAVLSNLQEIVEWLGKMGMSVFPESVYGLAAIPHRVVFGDVFWTVAFVYTFGFFASFIPASIAAAKDPVAALNE